MSRGRAEVQEEHPGVLTLRLPGGGLRRPTLVIDRHRRIVTWPGGPLGARRDLWFDEVAGFVLAPKVLVRRRYLEIPALDLSLLAHDGTRIALGRWYPVRHDLVALEPLLVRLEAATGLPVIDLRVDVNDGDADVWTRRAVAARVRADVGVAERRPGVLQVGRHDAGAWAAITGVGSMFVLPWACGVAAILLQGASDATVGAIFSTMPPLLIASIAVAAWRAMDATVVTFDLRARTLSARDGLFAARRRIAFDDVAAFEGGREGEGPTAAALITARLVGGGLVTVARFRDGDDRLVRRQWLAEHLSRATGIPIGDLRGPFCWLAAANIEAGPDGEGTFGERPRPDGRGAVRRRAG